MNDRNTVGFIGIGAPRSGTTWVSKCLEEHPDILFSSEKSVKELHFFNEPDWRKCVPRDISNYHKGIDWYLDQLPPAEPGKIRGEFSTSYLSSRVACQRIRKHFPEVKILVILRNPVEMVYSLHHFMCKSPRADVPEKFVDAWENGFYKGIGLYHKHLSCYFEEFLREQIHIMLLNDVKINPENVVRKLYSFLGVDEKFRPSSLYQRVNPKTAVRFPVVANAVQFTISVVRRFGPSNLYNKIFQSPTLLRIYSGLNELQVGYQKTPFAVRRELEEYFCEDIGKLEKLLGRDLSPWRRD